MTSRAMHYVRCSGRQLACKGASLRLQLLYRDRLDHCMQLRRWQASFGSWAWPSLCRRRPGLLACVCGCHRASSAAFAATPWAGEPAVRGDGQLHRCRFLVACVRVQALAHAAWSSGHVCPCHSATVHPSPTGGCDRTLEFLKPGTGRHLRQRARRPGGNYMSA